MIPADHVARMQSVIEAMHRRPWWRVGILHRRPWRAGFSPGGMWWQWLRYAHDCADPMIGCSCFGGFLFPADCTGHAVADAPTAPMSVHDPAEDLEVIP